MVLPVHAFIGFSTQFIIQYAFSLQYCDYL